MTKRTEGRNVRMYAKGHCCNHARPTNVAADEIKGQAMKKHNYQGMCIGGVLDGTRIGSDESHLEYEGDKAAKRVKKSPDTPETRYRFVEYEILRGPKIGIWVAADLSDEAAIDMLVSGYRAQTDSSAVAGGLPAETTVER